MMFVELKLLDTRLHFSDNALLELCLLGWSCGLSIPEAAGFMPTASRIPSISWTVILSNCIIDPILYSPCYICSVGHNILLIITGVLL